MSQVIQQVRAWQKQAVVEDPSVAREEQDTDSRDSPGNDGAAEAL